MAPLITIILSIVNEKQDACLSPFAQGNRHLIPPVNSPDYTRIERKSFGFRGKE